MRCCDYWSARVRRNVRKQDNGVLRISNRDTETEFKSPHTLESTMRSRVETTVSGGETRTMSFAIGCFVQSTSNALGIGKLVECDAERAIVEYFASPAHREHIQREVPLRSLKTVDLESEVRVYVENRDTSAWQVGRVLDYHKSDRKYLVRFPNNESQMISVSDLRVRCLLPIAEPTDHLANQVNETAFWHEARSEFVRHLLEQHRVSRGLTALVSSSIELVAHQAAVIHKVLLDPFQRYLLADEVGLGKTIEAGVLIKQFTLDEPTNHETLVIVPDSLVAQWTLELTQRVHLGDSIGRSIRIVGSRDIKSISAHAETARMIVIDEAHHLSSWAWSSAQEEVLIFDIVRRACIDIRRKVLLLSATPVLHNEKSFLAMLHLLDPQVFPLNSLPLFRERVERRQEIAECMLSLNESESNFFVGRALEELGELLTNDVEFNSLRTQLSELIENNVDERDARRTSLILAIRTHVSDMWRLHRRIIRNRRTDNTAAYMPGRGGVKRVTYECHNEEGLAEAVSDWRLNVAAALSSSEESLKASAQFIVRRMDELAASDPGRAAGLAEQRLRDQEMFNSGGIPVSESESDLLKRIIRAAKACDLTAKMQKLLQIVGTSSTGDSYVVFADSPEIADEIFEFLNLRLPPGRTLRHSQENMSWTRFKSNHTGHVLICDRTAEEGLNLQKRGAAAIHFDLPFSPNRIEQRMGRLDRFGVGMPVQSVVLVCCGSGVQNAWCDLLEKTLCVFGRSIASLQYVIEESMNNIWIEYLDSGHQAIADAATLLGGDEGRVAKESKRILAQDEIDAFDADQITQKIADELESDDRKVSRESSTAFKKWAVADLRFRFRGEENRSDNVFTFEFMRRIDTGPKPFGHDTLISVNEFKGRFRKSIDDVPVTMPTVFTTVPLTFDRVTAQRRVTRLLRVGDPFVDAFEEFTRWDDRGVSYAFWRCVPNHRAIDDTDLFFRFDYVVSPALQPFDDLCSRYAGLITAGEASLGIFRFPDQPVKSRGIDARIQTSVLRHESFGDMISDPAIPIGPAEINIPRRPERRVLAPFDFHQCHIERASTQVVDEDPLRLPRFTVRIEKTVLVTEGDRSGRRLVDDVQNFQTGQLPRILGCFAARFIEKRGDRNHAFPKRSNLQLGVSFQLFEDERLDDLGRKPIAGDGTRIELIAHIPLGECRDPVWFQCGSFDGLLTDDDRRAIEKHNAWS